MKKHTPGPWQIAAPLGKGTAHRIWRNDEGPHAPDDAPNTNYRCVARDVHVPADARLIQAAPDLLAALEAAVNYAEFYKDGQPHVPAWYPKARAAIAKAKGE